MTTTPPNTMARIRELKAQGMTEAAAWHQAHGETIAWAHANGYATDKPNTKARNK